MTAPCKYCTRALFGLLRLMSNRSGVLYLASGTLSQLTVRSPASQLVGVHELDARAAHCGPRVVEKPGCVCNAGNSRHEVSATAKNRNKRMF